MIESLKEKKILNQAEAESLVRAGEYEVKEEPLSCCVDGRDHDHNAAAIPGADAGKIIEAVAALRDLQIPVDGALRGKLIDAVIQSVGGAERFRFHTDTHAEGTGRGCGHLRLASQNPADYHLSSDDMPAVFERLEALKGGEVVLEGDHAEGAVIVLTDKSKGMLHEALGTQAFVYHAAWDEERLARLADIIAEIPEVKESNKSSKEIYEMLLSVASLQRNFTLGQLAKGLPMYQVSEEVTPAGTV